MHIIPRYANLAEEPLDVNLVITWALDARTITSANVSDTWAIGGYASSQGGIPAGLKWVQKAVLLGKSVIQQLSFRYLAIYTRGKLLPYSRSHKNLALCS